MLDGSFYTTQRFAQPNPTVAEARVELNAAHRIFEGHFPGMPVVPGVCMLLLIKECLQKATQRQLTLSEAGNVKFLSVLDPTQHPVVDIRVNFEGSSAGILVTEATIHFGATSFIKLQHAKFTDYA